MNLSFQLYADENKTVPTYFPYKVLYGLLENKLIDLKVYDQCMKELSLRLPTPYGRDEDDISAKCTTIREDMRWRQGLDIHFIINNRKPTRYQFAPLLPARSVKPVEILYDEVTYKRAVLLDNRFIFHETNDDEVYRSERFKVLWQLEGFDSENAFWEWFKKPLKGVLIDWIS